jgi:NitT/TauT family transport system substrate-binding protein
MKPLKVAASLSALTLALAACGGGGDDAAAEQGGSIESAAAGEPVTLQVACAAGFEHMPRQLADTQGFNEDANLTTECIQVNTGPEQSAALLSGGLDVALMNAANLAPLLDQQQDLVVFGNLRTATYFDIVVDTGYDLPSGGDWESVVQALEGSRFGVVARGAGAEILASAMFRAAGVDPASVTFIATGLPPTTIAALEGDTIDAALMFEPGVTLAVEQGIGTNPFSLQEGEGPEELDHPDMLLVTSRANFEQNAEPLCRLTQTWTQGAEFLHDPANEDIVAAEAQTLLQLPDEVVAPLLERNIPFIQESTQLSEDIDKAFAVLADNGAAQQAYTADDFAVEVC